MARARSLMKTKAPLSTPTSSGARPAVVLGDLAAQLADAALQVGLADHDLAERGITLPR